MNRQKIKNILTKIGQIYPKYSLEEQVYNFGELIQFIPNPSEDMKLAREIQKDPSRIREIENPSETVGLAAVRKNPLAIKYIQNPSEKVGLAAVKKNPYSIEYIQNPSERVQLAAVEKSPYSIQFIQNPTVVVKEFLLSKGFNIHKDSFK